MQVTWTIMQFFWEKHFCFAKTALQLNVQIFFNIYFVDVGVGNLTSGELEEMQRKKNRPK